MVQCGARLASLWHLRLWCLADQSLKALRQGRGFLLVSDG